jgi:hypothetical protein
MITTNIENPVRLDWTGENIEKVRKDLSTEYYEDTDSSTVRMCCCIHGTNYTGDREEYIYELRSLYMKVIKKYLKKFTDCVIKVMCNYTDPYSDANTVEMRIVLVTDPNIITNNFHEQNKFWDKIQSLTISELDNCPVLQQEWITMSYLDVLVPILNNTYRGTEYQKITGDGIHLYKIIPTNFIKEFESEDVYISSINRIIRFNEYNYLIDELPSIKEEGMPEYDDYGINHVGKFNIFQGWESEFHTNYIEDASSTVDYIGQLDPGGFLIAWLAHIVQNPGFRTGVSISMNIDPGFSQYLQELLGFNWCRVLNIKNVADSLYIPLVIINDFTSTARQDSHTLREYLNQSQIYNLKIYPNHSNYIITPRLHKIIQGSAIYKVEGSVDFHPRRDHCNFLAYLLKINLNGYDFSVRQAVIDTFSKYMEWFEANASKLSWSESKKNCYKMSEVNNYYRTWCGDNSIQGSIHGLRQHLLGREYIVKNTRSVSNPGKTYMMLHL